MSTLWTWTKQSASLLWIVLWSKWRLICAAVAGVGAYLAFKPHAHAAEEPSEALEQARASAVRHAVATIEAEKGAAAAHAAVQQTYAKTIEHLDDTQQKEAEALLKDPKALAAYLVAAAKTEDQA